MTHGLTNHSIGKWQHERWGGPGGRDRDLYVKCIITLEMILMCYYVAERIKNKGMRVVGWYHSHPLFQPDPSVRFAFISFFRNSVSQFLASNLKGIFKVRSRTSSYSKMTKTERIASWVRLMPPMIIASQHFSLSSLGSVLVRKMAKTFLFASRTK